MSMRRQLLRGIAILLGAYFIVSLSRDVSELLESQERIIKQEEGVNKLEQEQEELVQELEYVMSEEFVEKEARDKLLMSRPGEEVYVLPELDKSESVGGVDSVDGDVRKLANWEKWLRLFY